MWVRLNDRELVNVDSKVVVIRKTDILNTNARGESFYYISFYENYDTTAKSARDLRFSTLEERNNAFETINSALDVVSIEREEEG